MRHIQNDKDIGLRQKNFHYEVFIFIFYYFGQFPVCPLKYYQITCKNRQAILKELKTKQTT